MNQPTLIAIDWGTSNLRAALLNADGQAIESRSTPGGVMAVKDGLFAEALSQLCGDWMQAYPCALIASGMVGSRQGWKEAPYLDCPASIDKAATNLTPIEINLQGGGSRRLYIAPGLRFQEASGVYDVMRGEETQIWGANISPNSCCILPGTHSKWAWTGQRGEILRFQTWMTGELLASTPSTAFWVDSCKQVLSRSSVLNRVFDWACLNRQRPTMWSLPHGRQGSWNKSPPTN